MTAAAEHQDPAAVMKPLPAPLVKATEHPGRFVKNKVVLLIDAVIFAYIGTLIIAASYYVLFETTSIMSNWWHRTVPTGDFRHAIRDVGEGLLGGLLAQHIVRNRYKKLNKTVTLNSNFIERTFGETRRRVKVIGRRPGESSCLNLVWAVLDRASRGCAA